MAIERFEIDTEQWAVVSKGALQMVVNALRRDAEDGRGVRGEMADELLAAAPRPEAVRQSDAFLVWLPRLIAEYEKQARHNEFTPDVSLDFVKRALAEYKHAAKQPTPRPVPTCERLPTEADADCMGCVWAFGLDLWQYEQVQFVDPWHHSHWQPTGLVRPAEVKP